MNDMGSYKFPNLLSIGSDFDMQKYKPYAHILEMIGLRTMASYLIVKPYSRSFGIFYCRP